ncbi:carbohydrate ABC transporter substrate-binding protein (CUT1 family) [Paenibacillus taihuensis]|uniref:Carbohydrate ABC transporter substrate-binding protein (CUT1 family) n=1 Tax=Paenibacillus taihuensis TaxID=1156355 RepID=A0A3D9QWE1_9BACL|nr:sugar ABC transporter substrate-binding protein [Paenibacillus taihuensis]REE69593.1 carbohydrate ABC transporter substrate-binding protein (CUT1 family) [Paenibacillus taihuensis]
MQPKQGKMKISTALLSVMLVSSIALTACGSSNDSSNTSNSSNSTNNSTSNAAADNSSSNSTDSNAAANNGGNTAAPAEKVTVEFWANKFEETTDNWFKKWVAEFNKSQDQIEVKLQIVPGDAWAQKLKAAQAAGKAPDFYTMNYGGIANAAKLSQIQPLNDLIDGAQYDDLYDNIKDFVSVGDKYYAYPMLVEPSAVLYYRKDLYTAAGLDPEKPPTTWQELIDNGKKLTQKGIFGLATGQTAGDLGWSSWGLQYGAAGHLALTDDWSKADINNDGYRAVINFYADAYKAGIMPKQALAGYADASPFGQGKVAQEISGSWAIGQYRNDFKNMLDKIGVAPMPSQNGDPSTTTATLGGWSLVVDGKSKHPKESAAFISYLLGGDPNVMIDFFKTAQFSKFSPRKSVDEAMKADPAASQDPWRALIAEKVIPFSKAEPIYPWDVSMAVSTAIESAMKGTDPEKALEKAEKDINDFIAKSKLAGTNPKQAAAQ